MLKAFKIIILGIVQGVGFRPFIYRIAKKSGVNGYVRNLGGSEVEILIEGYGKNIERFLHLLREELPPVAMIHDMKIEETTISGCKDFKILPSLKKSYLRSIVPPDFSVCDDCIKEVEDPSSRWYRYAFNSCAYCGPRYSIMQSIPYDRDKTSMVDFPLCRRCQDEYEDPENIRRFHAQGISCPRCGPKLWLVNMDGEVVRCKDPLSEAANLIEEGYILSIKGIGGFHIAALATDDEVVLKLRRRKRRPEKPFAIMVRNIDTLEKLVYLTEEAIKLLKSPQHPILLLEKREGSPISKYIAPGLLHLGVFLPYTPLHYILLGEIRDGFAIMTSGNPQGEPMCIKNTEVIRKLRGIVDYHLLHNRRIVNRVDDSVIRFTADRISMLRRGRGYAPNWFILDTQLENDIISFGAMLQNVGGIGFEDKAVLTQFIGDCDNYRTLLDLKIYLRRLAKLYRINLENNIVTVDLHPGYPTMQLAEEWAEKYNSELMKIQHHWAHIASVLAEYKMNREVVGIAIDGAGYGIDGNIWGGEILIATYKEFRRVGHIEYIPMPGGDIATIYPVRILAGILSRFMDEKEIIKFFRRYRLMKKSRRSNEELEVILNQIKMGRPLTSSAGRVLDAAAALLNVSHIRTYEGEPAMKLEAFSKPGETMLKIPIVNRGGKHILQITKMFEDLIGYVEDGVDKRILAYNVQRALGEALADVALKYSRDIVAVSGGAAVNTIILNTIIERGRKKGVKIVTNKNIPPGDGGIALGQIVIAGHKTLNRH